MAGIVRWAARKAVGAVTEQAKARARRAKCKAEPNGRGRLCNRPIRTGRLADGVTCGREMCQLWLMSHDEDATAAFLGMSVDDLRARVDAAQAA